MTIYLMQIVGAFFATACFSVVFNVSKKNLIICGIIGSVGWFIYIISLHMMSLSVVTASFVAS